MKGVLVLIAALAALLPTLARCSGIACLVPLLNREIQCQFEWAAVAWERALQIEEIWGIETMQTRCKAEAL